ncbi:hypothetical protein RJT34_15438 [Clitoria ternatea]|uniref:Disease resistance protein At4g27190-like leucine-rich repeats domain-containing protein n=1 Tax=Clitoria ternatea TaxID=43366 RepID=A0AAN9J5F0_CLITE
MMIEQGKLHVDLQKLKTLKLHHFGDESLDVFPFVFHSKVSLPCFQSLEFHESAFKQIFPSGGCNQNILSQLKELHLHKLSQLQSIGLEHSWMAPFPKKLETLSVSECHGLKYLFTSSTAKMLASLEEITVTNCESLQEIVLADEGELEEIMFNELGVLILMSLPKLGSFYKGTSTLKLPSLSRVSFTHCHNTKLFPHRDSLPRLSYVKIDGEYYYGDDMHYLLEVVAA